MGDNFIKGAFGLFSFDVGTAIIIAEFGYLGAFHRPASGIFDLFGVAVLVDEAGVAGEVVGGAVIVKT